MFYQKRPNLKNNVELKLVLTKKQIQDSYKSNWNSDNMNYVLVDINCRLKVVFNGSGNFFTDKASLK